MTPIPSSSAGTHALTGLFWSVEQLHKRQRPECLLWVQSWEVQVMGSWCMKE